MSGVERSNGDGDPRLAGGIAGFAKAHGGHGADLGEVDPDGFAAHALRNLYNEVWANDALSMRDKRLLVIGVLAAQSLEYGMGIHLRCGIELGDLKRDDVEPIKRLLAGYVGFPKTVLFDQVWQRVCVEMAGTADADETA